MHPILFDLGPATIYTYGVLLAAAYLLGLKLAMVRARDELRSAGLSTRLVLQIHDELLFEAPAADVEAASKIIVREMAGAFEMDPPLEVDCGVGQNWLEAK